MSASLRVALFLIAIFIPSAAITGFQPLFLADRGQSPAAIGQIMAIATMMRMLAMPLWGQLADRLRRPRAVLSAAAALAAAFGLSWVPLQGYGPLLAATMLYGACAAALMPMADAISLTLARQGRLDYGTVRAIGSIGFMASIAGSGWLIGQFGSGLVPWLVGLPYAVAALFALALPDTAPLAAAPAGGLRLLSLRPVRLAIAGSALLQGSHAALYGLASLHWRNHGLSERVIGLLWAEGVLAEIMLFFAGRHFAARLGPAGLIAGASVAALVRWSVTAGTTALPALVAVQALHGATYAMTHLAAMLLLSRAIPPERAAAAQTLHAALRAALPTGVLMWVTGQLYDGTGAVFLIMAGLGALALPVAWRISRLPAA